MSDDLLQLITAAVDGELTPAEARRLDEALAASPEARALHARFQADSKPPRELPRVPPPAALRPRVMARIAALPPVPLRVHDLSRPAEPNSPVIRPVAPVRRPRSWVP